MTSSRRGTPRRMPSWVSTSTRRPRTRAVMGSGGLAAGAQPILQECVVGALQGLVEGRLRVPAEEAPGLLDRGLARHHVLVALAEVGVGADGLQGRRHELAKPVVVRVSVTLRSIDRHAEPVYSVSIHDYE